MTQYLKVNKSDGTILKQKDFDNPTRNLGKAAVWLPVVVDDTKPDYNTTTEKLVRHYIMPDLTANLANSKVTYGLKKQAISDIEKLAILTAAMSEKLLQGETLTADEISERKLLTA